MNITRWTQPKFHIGDKVQLIGAPHIYEIMGVFRGETTYSYCYEAGGPYVAEDQLEPYLEPKLKEIVGDIERLLWSIEERAEMLGEKSIKLDAIPRHVQAEMDRVSRLVSRRFRS